jgi:hypothetical protein
VAEPVAEPVQGLFSNRFSAVPSHVGLNRRRARRPLEGARSPLTRGAEPGAGQCPALSRPAVPSHVGMNL